MPNLISVDRVGPYHGSQPHSHECWEIGYYLRGRGIAHIGESRVPFHPGTIICYPPHIPHSERTREACHGLFVAADRCSFGNGNAPAHADAREHFPEVIELLYDEWSHRLPHWKHATEHLFSLLIIHLERQFSSTPTSHPLVEKLRCEMEAHLADPDFHVGRALENLPMSPDHLRRLFAQETGRSPLTYLNEIRIMRAKQLLREGNQLVKQVATQVGIPDEYYFSRLFLKHTGQRPAAYRSGFTR